MNLQLQPPGVIGSNKNETEFCRRLVNPQAGPAEFSHRSRVLTGAIAKSHHI
jgi:hypothetical protein